MKLKELRNLNNISQMQLAEILNMNHRTISNYETGVREPDIQTLCALADYFNVSIDFLVGHSPADSTDSLLTEDEIMLIGDYRRLDKDDKIRLKKIMKALKNTSLEFESLASYDG